MHQAAKVDAVPQDGMHPDFRSDEELPWLGNIISTVGRGSFLPLLFTQSLTRDWHLVAPQ